MSTRVLTSSPRARRASVAAIAALGAAGCVALKDGGGALDGGAIVVDAGGDATVAPASGGGDAGGAQPVEDAGVDAAIDAAPPPPCTLSNTASGATCALGPTEAPSCAGLPKECGGGESCCTSTRVPGDSFARGYDRSQQVVQDGHSVVGFQNVDSAKANVSDVFLDRYEVTVGRFRRFLAAYDKWRSNKPFDDDGNVHGVVGTGWNRNLMNPSLPSASADIVAQMESATCGSQGGWSDDAGAHEAWPITCVSWFAAYAFCIWDGGRLPTEAEWNYAAAGGSQQRAFPWSNPADDTHSPAVAVANLDDTAGGLMNVGSTSGVGRWGHADLAGNAMEWTRDACTDCNEPAALEQNPGADLTSYTKKACSDCVETTGSSRILRGGSFKFWKALGRTAARAATAPLHSYDDIGFRCARDVPR